MRVKTQKSPANAVHLTLLDDVGSSAATGAGATWWVVAGAVLLATGLCPTHAARGRRATTDE